MQPPKEPVVSLSADTPREVGTPGVGEVQPAPAPTPAAAEAPVGQVADRSAADLAAPERAASAPSPLPQPANAAGQTARPTALTRASTPESEAEEVDVWWGSYSGWTLWPSTALCILLTALIALGESLWAPRDLRQWIFVGLAGSLWLVQGTRWAYRFFAVNYRLTTRRLFRDSGFLHPETVQISLKTVARAEVRRNAFENLARVGRLYIFFHDNQLPPLVLEGVRHPEAVAQMIDEWSEHLYDSRHMPHAS